MAYEKQTWECGDVITAEKMNHIEDGIENAGGGGTEVFPVEFERNGDTFYLRTPYNDARQAFSDRKILVGLTNVEGYGAREGLLAGVEDEYGITNFNFIFLKPFSDNSGLECAIVTLKYDNTVKTTIKEIAFTN